MVAIRFGVGVCRGCEVVRVEFGQEFGVIVATSRRFVEATTIDVVRNLPYWKRASL